MNSTRDRLEDLRTVIDRTLTTQNAVLSRIASSLQAWQFQVKRKLEGDMPKVQGREAEAAHIPGFTSASMIAAGAPSDGTNKVCLWSKFALWAFLWPELLACPRSAWPPRFLCAPPPSQAFFQLFPFPFSCFACCSHIGGTCYR